MGNELCHFIGIPLIVISLLGLLAAFPFEAGSFFGSPLFRIDGGSVFWALAILWYLWIDWRAGLSFSLVSLSAYFVGRTLPVPALWAFFVLGWIFQGIGHVVYEKKSPAFIKNFAHLLIGPLWVFARLTGLQ